MSAQDLLDLARRGASLDVQRAALPEPLRALARDGVVRRAGDADRRRADVRRRRLPYYVLRDADLRAQRFDRAMGIMQCS